MVVDIFHSGLHLVLLVRSVFQFGGNGHVVDLAVVAHLLFKTAARLFQVLLAHGLAQTAPVAAVMHTRVEKKTMVLHRVEMGKGYKMITVSLEKQAKL